MIPLAARELPFPQGETRQAAMQAMHLPENYLLYVGTIEPRKNLLTLLDAYGKLAESTRRSHRLIFAGGVGWGGNEFRQSLAEHPMADEVIAMGSVGDEQLGVLLAGATATLMPSFYEGFGLPVVESMACRTPVICSTAEVFGEVGGDGVAHIPCHDVGAWTVAIQRIIEDASWRDQLRNAGTRQIRKFDWKTTAARHAEVFEHVIQQSRA